jgi:hypothetical protein
MRRASMLAMVGLTVACVMAIGLVDDAVAGQFKTLNTAGLGVGAQVSAHSSPKNTGAAMEMEIYEWPRRWEAAATGAAS